MCRRVQCSRCKKPTFAGCGAHVEQVLADVPAESRCRCREETSQPKARNQPEDRLRQLVAAQIEGRTLGLLGEPRVNVLALNLALDELGRR